jgi:hypothetical protein
MIRNRIIHGGRFEEGEYEALISAKMNLLWILERCILRVLNWDIDKSKVHSPYLKHYFAYSNWQEFSTKLSKI